MKEMIRRVARKLSTMPLIGRLVNISAAIWRLPQFRVELATLQADSSRFNSVYRDQLPAILDALSKINARQHAIDQDQQNLVVSLPVALRTLRQDISRIHLDITRIDHELAGQQHEIGAGVAASRDALGGLSAKLEQKEGEIRGLNDFVQYVNGRVEFVRRELMFEMRYGHGSSGSESDSLETKARIVDAAKVEQARSAGVRLNLGCGHIPLDGYINVDRRELPGVDLVAEINALPPEVSGADEIFSSHMLEHFPQEQLRRELLPYWKSVLKEGGLLRAVVPDAEAMIREYSNGNYPYDDMREVLYGGQDYDGDFHFNMFTPEHMSRLLEEAGFEAINVIEAGRRNGKCFEFEISARRP